MGPRGRVLRAAALGLGLGAALALLAGLLWRAQRLPEGPQPVPWDREACAECHMHVGEPRFAAQLQTRDGRVLNFDDPGCLLRYEAARRLAVHAIYFHAYDEDRWLPAAEVAFISVEASPMGHDLGAVSRARPGALSLEQARAQVIGRGHQREAGP